jgi:hypothetical protein
MLSALFDEQLAAIDSSRGMVIAVGSAGTNFARHGLDLVSFVILDATMLRGSHAIEKKSIQCGRASVGQFVNFGSTQRHRFAEPPEHNR